MCEMPHMYGQDPESISLSSALYIMQYAAIRNLGSGGEEREFVWIWTYIHDASTMAFLQSIDIILIMIY